MWAEWAFNCVFDYARVTVSVGVIVGNGVGRGVGSRVRMFASVMAVMAAARPPRKLIAVTIWVKYFMIALMLPHRQARVGA